jgi:hypothetical protein
LVISDWTTTHTLHGVRYISSPTGSLGSQCNPYPSSHPIPLRYISVRFGRSHGTSPLPHRARTAASAQVPKSPGHPLASAKPPTGWRPPTGNGLGTSAPKQSPRRRAIAGRPPYRRATHRPVWVGYGFPLEPTAARRPPLLRRKQTSPISSSRPRPLPEPGPPRGCQSQ